MLAVSPSIIFTPSDDNNPAIAILANAIGIASIFVKYFTIIDDELIESKAIESNNHIFKLDCN